jgi:signal transduction histidine kinase
MTARDPSLATSLRHVISESGDALLDEWEAEVRRSSSASRDLPSHELRDDIPAFFGRLAKWLLTESRNTADAVDRETTGKHAKHRLEHGVELRDLVQEFRLLRQVVLRRGLASASEQDRFDLERFSDALDHAMIESVDAYARERDVARDLFLGIVGHDLRSPLSAIALGAESLLKAGTLNQAESRAVSRIARSADRVKRTLSDLLDVVRARFGAKMPVKVELVDVGDVADLAVAELRLVHGGRRVTFEATGNLRGQWDRDRIAQLVSNLVENALVHGEDPIQVALRGDSDAVELRVTNRGRPIPKEVIPTLFDPFRSASSSHREHAGMGLGLYVCAEIVRAHGGTIAVESDAITQFVVRLPRRTAK